MANKKKNAANPKRGNGLLVAAAVVLCAAVGIMFVLQQNKDMTTPNFGLDAASDAVSDTASDRDAAAEKTEKSDSGDVQVIAKGESLIIPVSSVSSTVSFYPIEVDGTRIEVLAVTDSDGDIRTAFNTCQICYSSGRGYYVQDGSELVCQNCGNRFSMDRVEVESGGCNPWPIFEANKTVTDESIQISYDFLSESKEIFSNWRTTF